MLSGLKLTKRKAGGGDEGGGEGGGGEGGGRGGGDARADAGLGWMSSAPARPPGAPSAAERAAAEAKQKAAEAAAEAAKPHPRELNPHLGGGGGGGSGGAAAGVGDGGASWRLKALKRARERAAREGQSLEEVVAVRHDSVAELAAPRGGRAAHAYAHRHAARDRERARARAAADGGGADAGGEGGAAQRGAGGERGDRGGRDERGRGRERYERERDGRERRRGDERGPGGTGGMRAPPPASGSWRRAERPRGGERRDDDRGGRNRARDDDRRVPDGDRRERGGGGGRGAELRSRPGLGAKPLSEEEQWERDQQPRPRSGGVAANAFASDGSFMARFTAAAGGGGKDQGAAAGENAKASAALPATAPGEEARSALAALAALAPGGAGVGSAGTVPGPTPAAKATERTAPVPAPAPAPAPAPVPVPSPAPSATPASAPAASGNASVAAMLRAKLGGRPMAKPAAPAQLPAAPAQPKVTPVAAPAAVAPGPQERQPKQLPVIDNSGRMADYSGAAQGGVNAATGRAQPKRVERYGEDGHKARYFASDDAEGKDLATLRAAEHKRRAGDLDENMARNIVRGHQRYKGPTSADDEYDYDMGVEAGDPRTSKRARRDGNFAASAARARGIADARSLERAAASDWLRATPHLVLAASERAYLMLAPATDRVVENHCYVVPMEHSGATRSLDDGTWEDMRNFKKCLMRMWGERGRQVVFLETAMKLDKKGAPPRCYVECVPVSAEAFSLAPMHFKRAIDEAEDEWSTHAAKRLIDTSGRGLRASVPVGFAYFHVEFGLRQGYAHVIDDELRWKRSFGRDVLKGAMGIEDRGGRRPKPNPALDAQAAAKLKAVYAKYDWVPQLADAARARAGGAQAGGSGGP